MSRSNEQWVADLKARREAVLVELRDTLVRNLRKAFQSDHRVEDAFVEDAVQDSVLRILDQLDQFAGRSRFLTWATSIAIRVAMSELRRSRWKDVAWDDVVSDGDWKSDLAVDAAPNPAEQFDRRSTSQLLYETIHSALTEKQRVVLLAELKGMPQDEIARHLGSNRNAIYKLAHDARKKLRKELESAGYSEDDFLSSSHI